VHALTTRWIERLAAFRFLFIVLVNLIPIGGVLLLGWNGAQVLILYWLENVIIGVMTLPRVLAARGQVQSPGQSGPQSSLGVGCFFIVHYGIFCLGHGVFTFAIAMDFLRSSDPAITGPLFDTPFLWALAGLAGLNLLALWRDWWQPRAWRTAHPITEMFRPYGRIFVLHIAVLGGAWAMQKYNAPEGAILILCVGKAVLELATGWLTGLKPDAAPTTPANPD
tara:strand:+ start:143 stop:811 length:669 start_codon:yes stop_codon:yes gene_type:complete